MFSLRLASIAALSLLLSLSGQGAIAQNTPSTPAAPGQPACPHATLRLETQQPVDAAAICAAATPWAKEGIRVFVLVTDTVGATEEEWFSYLDRVESEVGIRDLSVQNGFDKTAFSLAASTDISKPWGYSLTLGERLQQTPLKGSQGILDRLKTDLRNQMGAGQPTQAVVDALTLAYNTAFPASFPWAAAAGGVAGVAALGGAGTAIANNQRRLKQMRDRLNILQLRTSNLLMACDGLLSGGQPQDTLLYQTYSLNGGELYPELTAQVVGWILTCQATKEAAFGVFNQLTDDATQDKRPLEERGKDWETLYVTIVGNRDRILNLTDEELRSLLDPVLIPDRSDPGGQLTAQLQKVRQNIEGTPLKVELTTIDPTQIDAEGMLGAIDRVKAQALRLQKATEAAPDRLLEVSQQRQAVAARIPDNFTTPKAEIFAGIDARLQGSTRDLDAGLYLRVVEETEAIARDLNAVQAFADAVVSHNRRLSAIKAVTDSGYRPPRLRSDLQEVKSNFEAIRRAIAAGDYLEAANWVEELNADSQRALTESEAWQALHQQNRDRIGELQQQLTALASLQADAEQAWQRLQNYPQSNWVQVDGELETGIASGQRVRNEQLPRIQSCNDLQTQEFAEAEELLTQAGAELDSARARFGAVMACLEQVQAAEANLSAALDRTEADLQQLVSLRDREDAKIDPEVDRQIDWVRTQFDDTRRLAANREFLPAFNQQANLRNTIAAAYASAREQVENINHLLRDLEQAQRRSQQEIDRFLAEARDLPAPVQTSDINTLTRQVTAEVYRLQQESFQGFRSLEDRAWAQELSAQIRLYEELTALAERGSREIDRAQREYDRCVRRAQEAANEALSAIEAAASVVNHPDANGAGSHALGQARSLLPDLQLNEYTTVDALMRYEQQANQAKEAAQQAERQAQQRIDDARPTPPPSTLDRHEEDGSSSERDSSMGSSLRL